MSESPEIYGRIERYRAGEMTAAEARSFMEEVKINDALRQALNEYDAALAEIKDFGFRQHVQRKLGELHEHRTPLIKPVHYRVAAAVALFLLGGGYYYYAAMKDSRLFNQYFTPYPDLITTRQAGSGPLQKGMYLYSSGRYDEATLALDSVSNATQKLHAMFYKSQIELMQGSTDEAITHLTEVREHTDEYDQEATWYLAIAALKKKDKAQCLSLLAEIKQGDFNYDKAQRLKEKLSSSW